MKKIPKKVKYPKHIDSDQKKIQYLFRLTEVMRLRHNEKGIDYKEGRITESEWLEFVEWFRERQGFINSKINEVKDAFRYDGTDIDLDLVFEEEQMPEE